MWGVEPQYTVSWVEVRSSARVAKDSAQFSYPTWYSSRTHRPRFDHRIFWCRIVRKPSVNSQRYSTFLNTTICSTRGIMVSPVPIDPASYIPWYSTTTHVSSVLWRHICLWCSWRSSDRDRGMVSRLSGTMWVVMNSLSFLWDFSKNGMQSGNITCRLSYSGPPICIQIKRKDFSTSLSGIHEQTKYLLNT